MLKVEPRFQLDQTYKGPFEIKSLSTTNAVIVLKGDDKSEETLRKTLEKKTSTEERSRCTRNCTTGRSYCQFARGSFC